MRHLLLFIIFTISLQSGYAELKDSIPEEGIERVIALNDLAKEFLDSDPDKSREYSIKARDLANALEEYHELSNALNYIGLSYYNQKQYNEAISFFQQASRVSLRLGARDKAGNIFQKIGMSYILLKDYPKAIFYYQQTVRIFEQLEQDDHVAETYFDLGVVYFLAREYSNSINALNSALKFYAKLDNQRGIARTHSQLGTTYEETGNLKEALSHFQQALQIQQLFHNKDQIAFNLNNIGQIYFKLKQLEKSNETLEEALKYCNKNYTELYSKILLNIGKVKFLKRDYKAAEDEYNKALVLADSIKNNTLLSDIYHNLYLLHIETNDSRRALESYQKFVTLKDSTAIETPIIQTRIKTEYDDKYGNVYVAIFIVLTAIIIWLTIVVIRIKNQRDKALEILRKHNIDVSND